MVNTSNEFQAVDRAPCPHYEEDCYWETEWWREGKTTGYQHRICRDCGFHVERRPQQIFSDHLMDELGVPRDSGFVFKQMEVVLKELDEKRWEEITEDTPQEVGHGENISKDAPSPG